MKKIVMTLILCLPAACPCFAQNNMEGMRILTVNALMQYGQNLYERGDFDGATAVFNHVLTYDDHQAQALKYLKEMGHAPVSDDPVPEPVLQEVEPSAAPTIDFSDTDSIRKAIEAKKRVIAKLQAQIVQMRGDLNAQSVEY